MGDLGAPQQTVMRKLGISRAPIFDGHFLDPKGSGKIDSVFFRQSIIQAFPDPKSKGIGLLDLEDKNWTAIIIGSADGVTFDEGMLQMLRMIRIARETRPLITWSIYNLPYIEYWQKNDLWKTQLDRLKPLFELVDALTPSLYDFYPDTTRFTDDKVFIEDNLGLALKIGNTLKKPVIPYIWHRWHDGNPVFGLHLIDEKEFKLHLRRMLEANYNGTQVSGFVWFGAQNYFYNIKPELASLDRQKVNAPIGKEKETVLSVYGNYILETIRTVRKK
jgi:hypothetical protein